MSNRIPIEELVDVNEYRREIERTIIIPADFPEIDELIDSGARLELIRTTPRSGEVKIDAVLQLFVTYRPVDDRNRVITYQRTTQFDEIVPFEEARFGMEVDVDVIPREVEFNIIGVRRVKIVFPVIYEIALFREDDLRYIIESDGYTIVTRPYQIQKGIIEEEGEVTITRTETLAEQIESSRDILALDSEIIINTVETRRNQVIVKGEVITTIVYVSASGEIVSRRLNNYFRESFDISGVREEMDAYVEGVIIQENSIFQSPSRLKLSYQVQFNILLISEEEIELPVEIIETDLVPKKEYILVEKSVREEKTKFLVREDITISENQPDAAKVIRSLAQITEVDVDRLDDGIVIDGDGEVNYLYVSTAPDQPVYATRDRFSFSKFIDLLDLNENSRVYTELRVDRVNSTLEDERTISSRIIIEAKIMVTELIRVPVIVDVTDREQEEIEDGYSRYVVKSGDSLWLIAQKFNTTVDRIANANNINVSSQLQIGQKLLIPV